MHIAYLQDAVHPFNRGGRETRRHELARRLAARGHHVTIYTMKWWPGSARSIWQDGYELVAASPHWPLYSGPRRSLKQAAGWALATLPAVLRAPFDLLEVDSMPHAHVLPARLAAGLRRRPMLVTWHEVWDLGYWTRYAGAVGVAGWAMERLAAAASPVPVVVSAHARDRIRNPRAVVLPNGVDLAAMDLAAMDLAAMGTIPAKEHRWDVGTVGRLMSHKRVDLLIEAANAAGWRTLVMGTGPEEDRLRALAGPTVDVTGRIDDDQEVWSRLRACRVFACLSEREGFGISILEALSLGLPVVTSDHPDNAGQALIQSGVNGFVVPNQQAAVTQAIDTCLAQAPTLGPAARVSAQGYDWEAIVDRAEEIYRDALGSA